MAGKVYVFNCFNEPVTGLSVAGSEVGDIAPPSPGGKEKPMKFTPNGIEVGRAKTRTKECFAVGNNIVVIPWASFEGTVTVKIPDPKEKPPISIEDNLVLFLCTNYAILLTERGYIYEQFAVELMSQGKKVTADA